MRRLLFLPERAAIEAAAAMNTKTLPELLQGFVSREFLMHAATAAFAMLLLWRNENSELGAMLLAGAVGHYGILRTLDKRTEKKAKAEVEKAEIEAQAVVQKATLGVPETTIEVG